MVETKMDGDRKRPDWETKHAISHAEARQVAERFIAGHFRNAGKETPRITIPADPERNDDLLILSYIAQQERAELDRLRERRPDAAMRKTQQSWKVWVRLGASPVAGDFIEDITIYDCSEKPRYVRGTLTLDDLVRLSSPVDGERDAVIEECKSVVRSFAEGHNASGAFAGIVLNAVDALDALKSHSSGGEATK